MTDPLLLKRLAQRLKETAAVTPANDDLWSVLAALAADEVAKTIVVNQQPLPVLPFLALVQAGERYGGVVAQAAAATDLVAPVTAYFQGGGTGPIWLVRVLNVYAAT